MARYLKFLPPLLAAAMLGACGTLAGSTDQQVLVQTIQDNREVGGAGCILSNDVGKWFVTTPGRVVIRKSMGPLRVDCKKSGGGSASEAIDSQRNGGLLLGNVVMTLGVGYLVDRSTGTAFDYPSTLTIVMKPKEVPLPVAAPQAPTQAPEPPPPKPELPAGPSELY
ncbi:hypothetical protein [Janthinobacterium agaricidamnosum]|uniref:Lipoprotein n=1 Tax=Janthinobacterium agaricidamnosum NBRC 102515 = DSM 9628 TaxID=1349767 RepID=W0V6U6_9BURK|nr:hypothetical protein [Janthinobacterium agaricidamnosum]CDG84549.1 putative uncharacterized protein [Janthinobacterium agaricidamnosum NBRC 102515 = DSM 9628]